MKKKNKSHEKLPEVEKLRAQLAEAEETLHAIRSGEVDALVVSGEKGEQIFTLKGAEQPYRILIEEMSEGAVMLTADDSILYCNSSFASMLKTPLEKLMGTGIAHYIAPADEAVFRELLRQGRERSSRGEITLLAGNGTFVSTHISFNTLQMDDARLVYLVATDLTKRKQMEEALRRARDELEIRVEERTAELTKSEQRWATTLVSIGDAVISTDAGGRITFMNAVAETLTDWTLAEASARPVTEIFNIINEFTRAEVENPVTRVLQEGLIVGLANHTILVRKDGTEVPIDDSGAPIRDGDGETMGVVLVFRDITERKRAEEELIESEDKFRYVFEYSIVGKSITFPSGEIHVNNAFGEMLGYSQEELQNSKWQDITHPDDIELTQKALDPILSGEKDSARFIKRYLHKNGSFVWGDVSTSLRRDKEDKPVYFMTSVIDITERKQAEVALRESEQRWATTLASIGDAVISTDVEGRITFMNAEAEALTGWTLTEASARLVIEIFNIINGHTRREADNPVTRVLREGLIVGLANHTILVKKDGKEVPIDDSGAPIRDQDGKTMGVVLVFRDITERKQAEEALAADLAATTRLLQIGARFVKEGELADVLGDIVDAAIAITHADMGNIQLLDAQSGCLKVAASRGFEQPFVDFWNAVAHGQGACGTAMRNAQRVIVEDVAQSPIFVGTPALEVQINAGVRAVQSTPLFGHSGALIGMLSTHWHVPHRPDQRELLLLDLLAQEAVDIIERAHAEEALRNNIRLLEDVIDGSISPIFLKDRNGKFITINASLERMLGKSRQELKGKTDYDIAPKEVADYWQSHDTKVIATGKAIQIEEVADLQDGHHIFLANKFPLVDGNGQVYGVGAISHDITERKRAEEALRKAHDELELRVQERTAQLRETNKALLESEASYRELSESIDDLFYAMDRDLRCTYWNKASEALTGILAKDAIGKSIYELFPDSKGTKVEQFYIEALKTQQLERFESEYKIGDKKFILEINAYPTKTGISVIAKDITERKMLESQLLRAQRMESIGTLAGGIAHDLNNVLTPMMLSLHMLKEKHKDEQSQKLFTILEKNSERGANLIKQVLSFARGVEGERKPLQIMNHISEIEKVLKETLPRNIEIRTDIQKDLFTISGDSTQLHQVIMNLCMNARDAMPDGGILDITASNFFIDENYAQMHNEAKVGSYVVVAVSDTGIGIPPKIVDRIFEPFYTTKEFGKGTGLGLSTALAIVKSHGGFINVYSEVGEGTTFRVYLPSIKTELQSVKEEQFELPVGNGESVLVAEDEDSIREITVSTLEAYGYKVLTASDGAGAVAMYAQNKDKIEVVLMDMMMPVMDGHASIRAIRKINPMVKIIAVSGLAENDKLAKIANTGVHAFLPKPYTAESLLKTIHEVLSAK